jgi:hypothetical protein
MTYSAPWIFVIDTEDYSGNFERELCAYITGHIGECGVGDEMAEHFEKEVGEPLKNVVEEPDEDNGCLRPTVIYPTPGWFNHGYGEHFRDGEDEKALKSFREVAAANERNSYECTYLKAWLEDESVRKAYEHAGWTLEKLQEAAAKHEKAAREAEAAETFEKYPAYLSVAIFFGKKPTEEQIALMKERALKYADFPYEYDRRRKNISKITGFRLIKNNVKVELEETAV